MWLLTHVSQWMGGNMPLTRLVALLKEKQVAHSSDRTIDESIVVYTMLALCPSLAVKFTTAFTRNRTTKVNLVQQSLSSMCAFNTNRRLLLSKIYDSRFMRQEKYRDILKTMEHSSQVLCTPVHDAGDQLWATYPSNALVTCIGPHRKKRSWLVEKSLLELFRSFFSVRHFHQEIEMMAQLWLECNKKKRLDSISYNAAREMAHKFKTAESESLKKRYKHARKVLQSALYTYI